MIRGELATTMEAMRIALVSPYSWSYPGGVTRHIEALAERFIEDGHHVRVLAPFDPLDRVSTVLPRGAGPTRRLQGKRRGLQRVDHPARSGDDAQGAADWGLRRRTRP